MTVVAAGCVVVAMGGTGSAAGDVTRHVPRSGLSAQSHSHSHSGIDTSSEAAVNHAYFRDYVSNLSVPMHWTGRISGCHAGHIARHTQQATLQALNFVRGLGQLGPVSFEAKLSAKSQKAALIMAANNALDHFPPKSWKCWSKAGYDGAGHSDLAFQYPQITAGATVGIYMNDEGDSNIEVGHRRWLMFPPATKFGDGATNVTNAMWVVGPTSASQPEPAWVSWPTSGWFPNPLEPSGRWSLSSSDSAADFSHAHVRVVARNGVALPVHRYPVFVGYGDPTVVWHVKSVRATGHYRVTVSHIKYFDRKGVFSHSYYVNLFTPKR